MKYFFYSRKTGYLDGHKLKVFMSNEYDDPEDKTKEFVDLSGKEMLERNIPEQTLGPFEIWSSHRCSSNPLIFYGDNFDHIFLYSTILSCYSRENN